MLQSHAGPLHSPSHLLFLVPCASWHSDETDDQRLGRESYSEETNDQRFGREPDSEETDEQSFGRGPDSEETDEQKSGCDFFL